MISCKKKQKGISDPAWQFEMQKLTGDYCAKLSSCTDDLIQQMPKNLQKYTSSIIKQEKCIEANKNSRAYHLVKEHPDFIKKITRECFTFATQLSCEELKSGKHEKNESCQLLIKYQKG